MTAETEKTPLLQGDEITQNNTGDVEIRLNASSSFSQCRVYKRRWYILFVFTMTSIVLNWMWNSWGPIQRPSRLVFRWEKWTILLLSSLGATGPILGAFPFTWLLDSKGLRIAVVVTSSMLLTGKVIQLVPFHNITVRTVFICIGHLMTMLPSFIANGAPPIVSNTWFPPNERTTATAIGAYGANFGYAMAFFIGPSIVPSTNDSSTKQDWGNLSKNYIHLVQKEIADYLYLQVGLASFLFLCVITYFPSKPPLPPSITALTRTTTEMGFKEGLQMLICNKSYWVLIAVFAISYGIYIGWLSVLDLALQPFNVSEKTSGLLGTCSNLAGIISGVIFARLADTVKRWTKRILVCLFIGTAIMQLIFTLTCSKILPFSQTLLFTSIICGGLLFNGAIPLAYELIMECVFPVGDGMAMGIALILGNAVVFLFNAIFMFRTVDVRWMNWTVVGGIMVCIPFLLLNKIQYRRLIHDSAK